MTERPLYFDITEAMLAASARRIQYYGIARTVVELAHELKSLDSNVRFVAFSFGHDAFFEIPVVSRDREAEITFPQGLRQRWVRRYHGNRLLDLLAAIPAIFAKRVNRQWWDAAGGSLRKADMPGAVLVSAARPKLIVDMIRASRGRGEDVQFVPLLHDFMPLHAWSTKRFRKFDRSFLADNRYVIANSSLILTNSAFTREELERFAARGILPAARRVVPVPLVQYCAAGSEEPSFTLPGEPYLLTVGSNLGRKNIEAVFGAMQILAQRGQAVPLLVVAGAERHRLSRHLQRPEMAAIRDRVVFAINPHQTDLVRLYRNALALAIPSRIEGWGLPAGEALWCGTPAICSTSPVFREVCGDLGLYFDPDDPAALADIVARLNEDEDYRNDLRRRIADASASLRTWKDVAVDLLAAVGKDGKDGRGREARPSL